MRASSRFLLFLAAAALGFAGAARHAAAERERRAAEVEARTALVRRLGLTDLALFTEARYTRHPSQADRFTPFQEHPSSLEHFPSGSIAAPPRD
ncbi:MAG TPA: hypothetical protein VFL83_02345 [Anaeromyxobacter sp.]|nr:hypothetical protein [Anaeromyxobacter sp.]